MMGNPIWTGKQHLITGPLKNAPIVDADVWGVDWAVSAYNGMQQPDVTYRYLFGYSWVGNQVRTRTDFHYDNGRRVTDVKFKFALDGVDVGSPASQPNNLSMSNMVYNYKDQLTERNIAYNGTTALQSVDYTYNLRGWLTAINDITIFGQNIPILTLPMNPGNGYIQGMAAMPLAKQAITESLKSGSNSPSGGWGAPPVADNETNNGDLYKQALTYGSIDTRTGGTPQYNGNISTTTWQVKGRDKMGYAFTYDDLDRLLNAKYFDITDSGVGTPSQTSTYTTDNKFEEKQTYDLRGNILTLERNGLNTGTWTNGKQGFTAATYGKIDNLQFNYADGNKLVRVQENSLPDRGFKTIKSPTDYNWQYGYDANGNLRYDFNKNLSYIWYNHLNLPTFIIFTDGRQMTLNYTADGELIQKTTWNPLDNTGYWLQYVNGIEYKNWVLDRIPHPEGAVIRNSTGAYEYEYLLKDHLGSNRVVFRDKDNDRIIDTSDIKQINHTYPFGMDMEGNWNGSFVGTGTAGNAYKYNGKEHHTDFGLGWYNYGARYYAPDAPRWTTLDPLAEKYLAESPYNYVSQNPMNFTDPTGMSKDGVGINSSGNIIYDDNKDDGKLYYLYDKKDKINSLEGQNYAEISSGWGQWTEHKDTRLFMDAVFRYVGYGNNLSDYGDIVYSKSQTALAAIDPRGDKNKLVSSASSTAVEFNYLSKPNLELTEYKGLSNIHILRSVLEHEGLHMKQIATGQFEKRSQKSWWASVYHYMYTVRGPAESAAYNAQINNDSKHWQNVLLRANQHYMQGALFMEFVKKVKDGRDTERAIWENAANRLGLPIPPK